VLHWLIALLVSFQLFFGESMTSLVDALDGGDPVSPSIQTWGAAHYWIGLAILGLVAVRLIVRFVGGTPMPAEHGPKWMQIAARVSHALFYILLVATPILGLLAFYVGDPWGDIHALNKPIFIVLIGIHASAAFYHQLWLRDGTLKRMLVPGEEG